MNDVLLRAQLRQQQAQVQLSEANLARDDAALSRAQALKERGFLSQASLDTALADQRASQANLSAARATLAQIQTQVSQATIRAPVPETELALIAPGQSATITASEAGATTGTVRIVTPQVDPQTRLGLARISLAPGSALKSGMFARAQIAVGDQPATTVPTPSVLYRNNRAGVFLLNADNASVTFTPVTVLARTDQATSVANISPGAKVVVQGAGFLNDGDRVTIAGAPAPAPAQQPARK
ncbi:hypothetical protein LTR94_027161 [Friedmanniomyces endolithicus]|nr:hypothetical protein LTR94_027161 [Friedmanniomyces endolithicus]